MKRLFISTILLGTSLLSIGQNIKTANNLKLTNNSFPPSSELKSSHSYQPETATLNKRILTYAIATEATIYTGGMSYMQFVWYKDHERVPFHFYNDSKGYLQMDKMGHGFTSYLESYTGYHWLRRAGVSKNKALIYGGTLGFFMQLPIEIFDGLYEGWGFSWSDIAANTTGSAFMIGQELLFDEQVIHWKMSFSPSEYYKNTSGYLGKTAFQSFVYDYNSHTHWLSTNINRLAFHDELPPWLNIAVGYSANGMLGEFKNRSYYMGSRLPQYDRTRQFLMSLDVDWEKIPTRSPLLKSIFKACNFIKIPFPTAEVNSQGKLKGYWFYF